MSVTLDEISQVSILTPIRKGSPPGNPELSWRQSVELLLTGAQARIARDGPSALRNVPTLVFAKWTVIDLAGEGDGWLLLVAAFNGDPTQYLIDLCTHVRPEMDAIYSHCLGYPGGADIAAFVAYAEAHMLRTHVFYPAAVLRHRTMREIRRATNATLDHRPG